MMDARWNRLSFNGKRRKTSFFLCSFQSIFAGRSCNDFLSNLKNSHQSMGLYLSDYWSNEENNFYPNSTSLSCTPQYDFYPLKTFPFFADLNTSLVIRKIPYFSHMIKISIFTDIFLNFFAGEMYPRVPVITPYNCFGIRSKANMNILEFSDVLLKSKTPP